MKPLSIISLWLTAIIGAAILGLVTNAINAQVSDLGLREKTDTGKARQ